MHTCNKNKYKCWMKTIFFLSVFDAQLVSASKVLQVPLTIILKQNFTAIYANKLNTTIGCKNIVATKYWMQRHSLLQNGFRESVIN